MKFSFGMSRKHALLLPIAIAFLLFIIATDAAPYQELAPRKGWVPVYIRHGDEPLSEINPKLAEAFHENEGAQATKIESANLTLEDSKSTKPEEQPVETPEVAEATVAPAADKESSKTEGKESDIASFDVIKGLDKAENKQKS